MNKGQTTVAVIWIIGGICTWCGALSIAAYDAHGTIASLSSTVSDIKDNTQGIPELQREVDKSNEETADVKMYLEALLPRSGINPDAIVHEPTISVATST